MPFVFSIKDTYRQAVEAQTGGRNTVMYDDKGNPSIMVRVPKFTLSEVLDGAPNQVHPAFIVNGVEKSEIWISKYQNIVHDGRAYSIPAQDPRTSIDFDAARAACFAKGQGWHMMTNAEWAAIALWCLKAGTQPRGNNNYGRDHSATYEKGAEATSDGDGRTNRILTGTGPASWNHDGTPEGIADLNGNVWEWVDGLKLVNGKIYVHNDNDFDTGNQEGNTDGWVDTGKYFDNTEPGNDEESSNTVSGSIVLNDTRDNPMYTGGDTNSNYAENSQPFKSTSAATGVSVPDILRHLAIFPPEDVTDIANDRLYVRNYGERVPHRGGTWLAGSRAGVFYLSLYYPRSGSSSNRGFRSAFIG